MPATSEYFRVWLGALDEDSDESHSGDLFDDNIDTDLSHLIGMWHGRAGSSLLGIYRNQGQVMLKTLSHSSWRVKLLLCKARSRTASASRILPSKPNFM